MFGPGRARATSWIAATAAAASIAVVAAAPAAVAAVANPRAGSYAQMRSNHYYMELTFKNSRISNALHYDSCVRVPIVAPSVKVSSGQFSWTGKATDVLGKKWRVHIDGSFVSRTKATGHWSAKQLTGGSCASSIRYTVTRQQS